MTRSPGFAAAAPRAGACSCDSADVTGVGDHGRRVLVVRDPACPAHGARTPQQLVVEELRERGEWPPARRVEIRNFEERWRMTCDHPHRGHVVTLSYAAEHHRGCTREPVAYELGPGEGLG